MDYYQNRKKEENRDIKYRFALRIVIPQLVTCADPERGQVFLKNHKVIGFLSKTARDPLKIHKPTKPEFNVGPSLVRQRNAI